VVNAVSVVIPACNEEALIGRAINSAIKSAKFANIDNLEVVVVINRCTDKTEEVARSLNAKIVYCDQKNLSAIRNAGVNATTSDIILTIDADSVMSENMISEVINSLSNQNVVGGGCIIWPERISLGIFLTGLLLAPFVIFEQISAGLFFFRRADFDAINGFDVNFLSAEDIDFARRLKALGKKTSRKFKTIYKASIITSCRKFDTFGDWYFFKNPLMMLKLLRGKDRRYADLIWYDYHKK
jgi:glycosyltransferase involved in cell wall biosynthesis